MRLSIMAAVSENDVIGDHGEIPWKLPNDFVRMRALTWEHPIIMGRKTHESIGRVLPGRLNIIVTHHPETVLPGARAAGSLEEAIDIAAKEEAARNGDSSQPEAFIFGGQQLYEQSLPRVQRIYLTRVHAVIAGDAFFPPLRPEEWKVIDEERHERDATHTYPYTFLVYERRH